MSKSKKNVEAVSFVEAEPVVEIQPVIEPEPTVEFNVWFVMREKKIPPQHLREIIKADFEGQGLSKFATIEAFDRALLKYGIKL